MTCFLLTAEQLNQMPGILPANEIKLTLDRNTIVMNQISSAGLTKQNYSGLYKFFYKPLALTVRTMSPL
jgi:hypothetical protein